MVGASWWRLRMVMVSTLGLGVLMGASVGLGFGYLGGVVVSAWGGVGLRLGWCGVVWVTGEEKERRKEK